MKKHFSLVFAAILLGCGGGDRHEEAQLRETAQSRKIRDLNPPVLQINPSPTLGASGVFVFSGTATDDVQVARVTWRDAFGATGTASLVRILFGSYTWTAAAQSPEGPNTYTFTAVDGTGKTAAQTIAVRYPTPVTLSWVAPTTNDDGTELLDLAGYTLEYGTQTGAYSVSIDIKDLAALTYSFSTLPPATYFFTVSAYNVELTSSVRSQEVSKIVK